MTRKTEFKHILVGVDDSEDALLAFQYAIDTAKRRHAELHLPIARILPL